MKCAGCGRDVERGLNGHWAERLPNNTGTGTSHSYVCDWMPGPEPGTLAWADYHYVAGETQRHFRASEGDS